MPKPDEPHARTDQPEGLWRATMRYVPVGLALFAVQLDFFALNLALPTIAKDLGVPVTDLQWMLSGYLLSLGSCFVPAGKLGDTIGRRKVLIIGMIIFGGTSLVCALASAAPCSSRSACCRASGRRSSCRTRSRSSPRPRALSSAPASWASCSVSRARARHSAP
ncbi:MFS transporter [Agromyces mangrovi Wang et al. 2018]|uniref:MFS transporter n=1 Tax=Agromyces mangrovi TaxID=1858653 RepID=UPI002572B255|nr:MFS transporter [Agromyces mangrovi]BDZ63624.1 hypothetical protein GCM10025877_05620 [Agromyces mangrovi]